MDGKRVLIKTEKLTKKYEQATAVDGLDLEIYQGGLRPPGSQRRRQDHHHPHVDGFDGAYGGHGPGRGA